MTSYGFVKASANAKKLDKEIIALALPGYGGLTTTPTSVEVFFEDELDQSDIDILSSAVSTHNPSPTTEEIVNKTVKNAMAFGMQLLNEMASENIMLGITQAGMTNTVRKRCSEIISTLITGSLYDAMYEARQIPPEHKDGTFVTDARLLTFINKVETYLGISPLSTEL